MNIYKKYLASVFKDLETKHNYNFNMKIIIKNTESSTKNLDITKAQYLKIKEIILKGL